MRAGKNQNRVRIIGGMWRGRHVSFADAPGLRPTGDRLRETLFNWLQTQVPGSHCLDLFAGSGALGFEAASRGAAAVTLVDSHPQVCQQLGQQIEQLGGAQQLNVSCTDALTFLSSAQQAYDLVFVDPPFADNLHVQVLQQLADGGLLSPHAMVYLEIARPPGVPAKVSKETKGAQKSFAADLLVTAGMPAGWQVYKEKTSGGVACALLKP